MGPPGRRRSRPALPTALLLLGLWRAAVCGAGPWNREKPQNVQIHIVDSNFTIKWDWHIKSSENDSAVTFSAYYKPITGAKAEWKKLPGCSNVAAAMCNFSPVLDFKEEYKVRVRAKRGNTTSQWSKAVTFVPYLIAQVGPPSDVRLECFDGFININFSAPGHFQRRMFDESDFTYQLVIWRNASSEQPTNRSVYTSDTIDDLALNTTYCLKVRARLIDSQIEGSFSPVYCIQTSPKVLNPRPENVRVDALNTKFILKWDWDYNYDQNVSFTVQCIRNFLHQYGPVMPAWRSLSKCQDIITTECDFSSEINFFGVYSFRVWVSNGTRKPTSSKKITFDPFKDTEIGPPGVNVNIIEDLLQIKVLPPGESENQSMTEAYNLSYQVQIWKNSSESKKINRIEKQTFFTFPDLEPLAVYCLKVQAVAEEEKKTGQFSPVECITMGAGNSSFWKTLVILGLSVVAGVLIVSALYFFLYHIKHLINYVFFPSSNLPSHIKEYSQDQHMERKFLSYEEEPTDRCSIIQNTMSEEIDRTDDHYENKQSKQSSRDSGNYSNEDETGGAVQ